jgi:hypothetical protein
LQSSIQRLQTEVQTQQQQVARLEKLSTQLEGSEKDRRQLLQPTSSQGSGLFEILPELDEIAANAGVRGLELITRLTMRALWPLFR